MESENAASDLRMLRVVRLAVASMLDKKGHTAAREAERRLEAIASDTHGDQQRQALKLLAARIGRT